MTFDQPGGSTWAYLWKFKPRLRVSSIINYFCEHFQPFFLRSSDSSLNPIYDHINSTREGNVFRNKKEAVPKRSTSHNEISRSDEFHLVTC